MKKIVFVMVSILLTFTLSACKTEEVVQPINCFDGYHEEDGKCVEDDPVCFAPQDYADALTYSLVFEDEFDGTELDLDTWKYEVYGGGGNNEIQYYTNQNTEVSDGTLKIIAKHEEYSGFEYTSSRIITKGNVAWKYGIIEVSAKMPEALGTWAAIWMMPSVNYYGGWPDSGEIDIMEYVGYDIDAIYGTIHTRIYNHIDGTQKGSSVTGITDLDTAFHTYKVEWLPDRLNFYYDDHMYFTYQPNKYSSCPTFNVWPFNKSFYMILNVAVGGDWGGVQGVDPNDYPVTMEIDYVRVYQANELIDYDDHTS